MLSFVLIQHCLNVRDENGKGNHVLILGDSLLKIQRRAENCTAAASVISAELP